MTTLHELFDGSDSHLLPDTQHSPEPWIISHFGEIKCNQIDIISIGQSSTVIPFGAKRPRTEDRKRIVACVNALHDMDNKEIDEIREWAHGAGIGMALAMKDKAIGEYQLLVSDMKQQHAELLDAARYVAADLHSRGIVYPALDEAIAKAGVK